jgi:hypothetical protein
VNCNVFKYAYRSSHDIMVSMCYYRNLPKPVLEVFRRRRWLSGTILTSLVLDSTGFWVRISARTPILRNITTGGDIAGGFCPGAGFPSCHKSIYRVSEDNFRGSACVSEWMLISVKDGGLVFHNLRLHKDSKLK